MGVGVARSVLITLVRLWSRWTILVMVVTTAVSCLRYIYLYSIVYIDFSIFYSLYFILYILYSILNSLYSIVYIDVSIFYSLYCIFYIL